jgi:hypothetical protein
MFKRMRKEKQRKQSGTGRKLRGKEETKKKVSVFIHVS